MNNEELKKKLYDNYWSDKDNYTAKESMTLQKNHFVKQKEILKILQ